MTTAEQAAATEDIAAPPLMATKREAGMGTTNTGRAAEAYGAAILRQLGPTDRAILDAYATRALDDPRAAPRDDEERRVVARVEALIDRAAGRAREAAPRRPRQRAEGCRR